MFNAALGLAFAVAPCVGLRGLDAVGPTAVWVGSGVCGLVAAAVFFAVARRAEHLAPPRPTSP